MKELFFDIETLPAYTWGEIPENLKKIWIEKHHFKHLETEKDFLDKKFAIENLLPNIIKQEFDIGFEDIWNKYSPLYPEFANIVCISIGLIKQDGTFQIKTLKDDISEKDMLKKFFKFLNENLKYVLVGHNIKGFDMPFIMRKSFYYELDLPEQLKVIGKKPWEIKCVDIAEDYKGGMWSMVSLDLMCEFLNVDTPKDKFANHEVTSLYMKNKITKNDIVEYCEKDIKATIELFLKIYG